MILILEGRRATGKTTLSTKLEKRGWRRMKKIRNFPPFFEMLYLIPRMVISGDDWIVDRFHLTEFIYRASEHQGNSFFVWWKLTQIVFIHWLLRLVGAKIIILNTHETIRDRRIQESGKDDEPHNRAVKLLFLFCELFFADETWDTSFPRADTDDFLEIVDEYKNK